jgi:CheY-like chemotaxis protein
MISTAPTVLLVEDEVFIRIVAADSLAESGFQVLEAADAESALHLLDQHEEVVVLFTDINMPGEIDGLELAEIATRRRPHVKVVVTSGREWIDNSRLPDHGVYLPKPYRPAQLSSVIRAQAGGY